MSNEKNAKLPKLNLGLTAAVAALLLAANPAQAVVTSYTSSASFFGDLATSGLAPTTENFDGETAGTTYTDSSTIGHITFSSFGPPNLLVTDDFATTSGSNYLGMDSVGLANQFSGGYNIDLSFPATNAVGFNIITGEIPNTSIFDNDIQLVVPSVGSAVLDVDALEATIGGTDSVFFVGLIDTDNTFTSAQIRYDAAAVGTIVFNIDDITTAIPEPSTIFLALGATVALVGWATSVISSSRIHQPQARPPYGCRAFFVGCHSAPTRRTNRLPRVMPISSETLPEGMAEPVLNSTEPATTRLSATRRPATMAKAFC